MKQTLKNIEASLIKICDHILSDEEKINDFGTFGDFNELN